MNGDDQSYVQDLNRLMQILNANKDKNFIKRIMEPQKYPTIDMPPELKQYGDWGTHLMSWEYGQSGKPMVYPRIVHDPMKDALNILQPQEAMQHALQTGEYIEFDKPEEADWFGQNYKKAWGPNWKRWEYPPK